MVESPQLATSPTASHEPHSEPQDLRRPDLRQPNLRNYGGQLHEVRPIYEAKSMVTRFKVARSTMPPWPDPKGQIHKAPATRST